MIVKYLCSKVCVKVSFFDRNRISLHISDDSKIWGNKYRSVLQEMTQQRF